MNKLIANSLAIGVLTLAQVAWADDLGKPMFGNRCAACHGAASVVADRFLQQGRHRHGAAGVGIEGLAPPLQNPELWKSLGENGAKYMAGVMTGGMTGTITVADVDYRGLVMPAQSFIASTELAMIAKYVVETLNAGASTPSIALIDELKAAPLPHAEIRAIRKGAK